MRGGEASKPSARASLSGSGSCDGSPPHSGRRRRGEGGGASAAGSAASEGGVAPRNGGPESWRTSLPGK